ncbi:coenzyme F430 synthase [Methanobacterium alcaliphilum]|uniref:coenzyme F430 synthase n=1 Tax=Methanobacterium alcaliphilum TaxID=392018 RepID=UPI00200A6B7A|nr:coenzyme F430 synthase [Methanobacterium alcaliphilum]MCK9150935.1 coenzyme F430 synthase [Methanobacterium alcaliphilum]
MNALIIDLTHSGFTIALELSKTSQFNEIWAWDLYQTMSNQQIADLKNKRIKLISNLPEPEELKNFCIIAPIHSPLDLNIHLTHHQAVNLILKEWKKSLKMPVIEITGVKGKTSVAGMLKSILTSENPLVLSSLGASICNQGSDIILKKNISITPASIIETIRLAEDYDYNMCIFESSLGGTGLADVGILTNISENYSIAQGRSTASKAKRQIFQSKITCCDHETLNEFYSDLKKLMRERINTFSLNDKYANLYAHNIKYGLKQTSFKIKAEGVKTTNNQVLNCSFSVETFAPAPHHVSNVLAAICGCLTLNMPIKTIQIGLKQFSGLLGRSSLKVKDKAVIIEEINPGINVKAIEKTIQMAKTMPSPFIILGGQYGITCEEIDEIKASDLLQNILKKDLIFNENNIILTHELGKGIKEKMEIKPVYIENPQKAIDYAITNQAKTIIFIYRSNYSNLELR